MGNNQRQRETKDAMGKLADYVASQIGLPRPQAHLQPVLRAAEIDHGGICRCAWQSSIAAGTDQSRVRFG